MSLYLYTLIICQIPFAAFVFSTLLLFLRICLLLFQRAQKHIPNLMSNMLAILAARISCHLLN